MFLIDLILLFLSLQLLTLFYLLMILTFVDWFLALFVYIRPPDQELFLSPANMLTSIIVVLYEVFECAAVLLFKLVL